MKVKSRESRRYGIYLIAVDQVHAPENWPEPYPNTFGETIIAPAAGRVISIANGMVDTLPGVFKNDGGPGNYIYIKIAEAQYLIIGHLRNGSFLVKEGDQVAIGQPLAEAGKSGSVSIPAVFLAVHTKEDPFDPENRSYPIYFKDVVQIGSGSEPGQFFPNRNDLFKPKPK
jgi:murein DD-endopeptidase MepM/ murein hydrolase activator NlpD